MNASWEIREGHVLDRLREFADGSVQCCITSPPYYGQRDYGVPPSMWGDGWEGCLGHEDTPGQFVAHLVEVFAEVRRVLRDDGTLWLVIGDSYAGARGGGQGKNSAFVGRSAAKARVRERGSDRIPPGIKPKDLIGIPWMVAFALRNDGWYLRSDIIWNKPNPMPESVIDRPTAAHEHVFLLSKSNRYYYDAEAIKEDDSGLAAGNGFAGRQDHRLSGGLAAGGTVEKWKPGAGRNKRNVWTVATQPYLGAHFATFPPQLIKPCILAGAPERTCAVCGAGWVRQVERSVDETRPPARQKPLVPEISRRNEGRNGHNSPTFGHHLVTKTVGWVRSCDHDDRTVPGLVLDPFAGAGTTGVVALRHGRSFVGIELSPEYAEMARERIRSDQPLFNSQLEAVA